MDERAQPHCLEMSPGADPEKVFQTARAIVGAELQKITLMDYLPVVLGWNNIQNLIGSYKGYKSNVNPSPPAVVEYGGSFECHTKDLR